jgi:beta-glucosidase-like glycosyl hydrolase
MPRTHQYKALQAQDDDEVESNLSRSPYRDNEEAIPLTDGSQPAHPPPPYSVATKRRNASFCNCRRLTKTCVAICVLVIALVAGSIGGTGYWAYRLQLIDGQSPPWYPSPRGGTVDNWQQSYEKAKEMVDRMSLAEKVNITTGVGWAMDVCVGNTAPAIDVGFPALCLQDGPLGLRFTDHATSFPAGITVGATWNRHLMRRRGEEHARQAKLKGVHVLLGPAMGPLGRHPAGGRNWEGFGADPVLQGVAASETILGIQSQGVMATAKHFVANEQEHYRKSFEWGLPEALSSNIDDRTMHEIYSWPFAESVRAGVASVMCSYQMVNNSYACQNSKLMNGILKDELGFQGFVQSDWLAHRSGVASALAGLDMTMPGDGIHWQDGKSLFGEELSIAVLNKSVPFFRINDMAARIVASWYQLGQDKWDSNGPNFSSWTDEEYGKLHDGSKSPQDNVIVNKFVKAESDDSKSIARQVAAEAITLLKNDDRLLPLDSKLTSIRGTGDKKKIAIVGDDAGPGKGANYCDDRACNQGTLAVGWGSGATEFTYLVDPFSAINETLDAATVDVTALLSDNLSSKQKKILSEQDLCLAFANADSGEGHQRWGSVRADRNGLELQKDGEQLIEDVAKSCGGPTVVVIHAVGAVLLNKTASQPGVKAILHAHLPGQESGNALVDVLFGKVDASGRLPYTIGDSLSDYGSGAPVMYYPNHLIPQADFKEGLYIDYRHFDKEKIEPQYPFGFGLSYTNFAYSDISVKELLPRSRLPKPRFTTVEPPQLKEELPDPSSMLFPSSIRRFKKFIYPYITSVDSVKKGDYPYPEGYSEVQIPSQAGGGEGGNPSLFEAHVQVDVRVKNVGERTGKEVVQLYVGLPSDIKDSHGALIDVPIRSLRNFTKIELEKGEDQVVSMTLSRKDLSYWDVVEQNWVLPEGKFQFSVGRDSRDMRLQKLY